MDGQMAVKEAVGPLEGVVYYLIADGQVTWGNVVSERADGRRWRGCG